MGGHSYPQHFDVIDETLKAKEKEVAKMRAAEKARVSFVFSRNV